MKGLHVRGCDFVQHMLCSARGSNTFVPLARRRWYRFDLVFLARNGQRVSPHSAPGKVRLQSDILTS